MIQQTREPTATHEALYLDTLLTIKRLAGKSGDHETDPYALLDLIAGYAREAINFSCVEHGK